MRFLLVGLGGFLGSVLRYTISGGVQRTLLVNVLGCFAIGLLMFAADERSMFSADARAFVFVGVLGGFTTFSAFGNDTMTLLRAGRSGEAFANVAAHLILGLGAVALGRIVAQAIWR
ncbi:MAG TPA: CrcB family protein [Thermoanaerobaculia bacterium]|jgi:CrcB protein